MAVQADLLAKVARLETAVRVLDGVVLPMLTAVLAAILPLERAAAVSVVVLSRPLSRLSSPLLSRRPSRARWRRARGRRVRQCRAQRRRSVQMLHVVGLADLHVRARLSGTVAVAVGGVELRLHTAGLVVTSCMEHAHRRGHVHF